MTSSITLEAYADTIVPGEKRWPGDRAIAGVSTGGGAVTGGALDLLRWDATGIHATAWRTWPGSSTSTPWSTRPRAV